MTNLKNEFLNEDITLFNEEMRVRLAFENMYPS